MTDSEVLATKYEGENTGFVQNRGLDYQKVGKNMQKVVKKHPPKSMDTRGEKVLFIRTFWKSGLSKH